MAPPATPPTSAPMAAPSQPPATAPTPAPTAAPAPAPMAVRSPGVAHAARAATTEANKRNCRIPTSYARFRLSFLHEPCRPSRPPGWRRHGTCEDPACAGDTRRLEGPSMRWPSLRQHGQATRPARHRAQAAMLLWTALLLLAASFAG